ncbi:MAG: hypothetical protein JWP81_5181 [Ferruginibacter sp.]|nr:hypothetical protein [Ferruginibacter sp.]
MQLIIVNGKQIVFAKKEDGYAAFEDRCSHRGGRWYNDLWNCAMPLVWLTIYGYTGEVKAGPAKEKILTQYWKRTESWMSLVYKILTPGIFNEVFLQLFENKPLKS